MFWTDGKKGTELKKVKVNKRTSPTTHRIRKTSAKAISRTGNGRRKSEKGIFIPGPSFPV